MRLTSTPGLPSPLSPDVSLCLFRVLQEALRDSAKRSGARCFEVRLSGVSGEIRVTVGDWGLGREAAKECRGIGLVGVEERLKLVDRNAFDSHHDPSRDTTVHTHVH